MCNNKPVYDFRLPYLGKIERACNFGSWIAINGKFRYAEKTNPDL